MGNTQRLCRWSALITFKMSVNTYRCSKLHRRSKFHRLIYAPIFTLDQGDKGTPFHHVCLRPASIASSSSFSFEPRLPLTVNVSRARELHLKVIQVEGLSFLVVTVVDISLAHLVSMVAQFFFRPCSTQNLHAFWKWAPLSAATAG